VRTAAALVALLTLAPAPAPRLQTAVVLNRHFTPGGSRYQYLPFDLSVGTESVTIGYKYSGDDGSSVIDLGLFEPGPLTLGTPAFRGYSGGSQRQIAVGRNHASPGYTTGPLPAGTWHVMLGMYKVAPAGVDVRVTITAAREDAPRPARPPDVRPPAPQTKAETRWYSGALHLHTLHSDGSIGPAALADAPPALRDSTSSSSPITTTSHTVVN
jgi:hypothetical protein